jgi:hypothetical protein
MTDLGTLGGDYSFPSSLNEAGQIAGQSYTAENVPRAFLASPFEYAETLVCDAAATKATYVDGQSVMASLQVENRGPTTLPIEAKLWLELPDASTLELSHDGADGALKIAGHYDRNTPFTLFHVEPWLPRGIYRLGCQFLDPVTGALKTQTLRPFLIQ